jgi:hypothetical protein
VGPEIGGGVEKLLLPHTHTTHTQTFNSPYQKQVYPPLLYMASSSYYTKFNIYLLFQRQNRKTGGPRGHENGRRGIKEEENEEEDENSLISD